MRIPIQVTRADSMTTLRAMAYLRELLHPPNLRAAQLAHLNCCGQNILRTVQNESPHIILYIIPPVISELAKNMDQPQATVISRVIGNNFLYNSSLK